MRHIKRLILFISLCFLLPAGVYAEVDAASQSNNVFKFQQKLANKGNARAQYKLATMYESGAGTKQDLEQAKHWYYKASSAGIKAASDRMTYLVVQQQGYDKTKHSAWLEGVRKDAKESKGDAMFLLAQLYREGLGVKKDLYRSREILDQVSLLGAADVEDEMAMIQQEIDANKKAKNTARKKYKVEQARLAKEKQHQAEQLSNINSAAVSAQEGAGSSNAEKPVGKVTAEDAIKAEKRRRYNKAMMALKLEQQKINEQQAWASGSDDEEADDEI